MSFAIKEANETKYYISILIDTSLIILEEFNSLNAERI